MIHGSSPCSNLDMRRGLETGYPIVRMHRGTGLATLEKEEKAQFQEPTIKLSRGHLAK
jgi:hypothetical protein